MNATPTEKPPVPNTWTEQSKKEMFLGLIIIIASIGTIPLFIAMSTGVQSIVPFIPLFFILIGLLISVAGYNSSH